MYQALKERGVEVRLTTPFRFVFVHEKSLVVDRKLAWVGTMNLTGSSFGANREYALLLDDPKQVAEIARVFEADWGGERLDLSRALLVWSPSRVLGGVKEGNAREVLLGLIRGAKKELFLEHQAMADPEVVEALKEALSRGVQVRILGSPQEPGDTYFLEGALALRAAGALVRFLPDPYVHAKVLVRDKEEALLGSHNLSANSLNANRELSVRFTAQEAPEAFQRLLSVMEGDWQRALPENPFALPPVEGVIPWQEAPRYFGRMATVEGVIQAVEDRGSVAFLRFGPGESDLRLVVFPRSYGLFAQPFPQSYLARRCGPGGGSSSTPGITRSFWRARKPSRCWMEALKALGYEVSPIEGGFYGEKRRGGVVYQVFYSEEGDLRLRRKRLLREEAHPLVLAGVEGEWAARLEVEENFFAVARPEDLPPWSWPLSGLTSRAQTPKLKPNMRPRRDNG